MRDDLIQYLLDYAWEHQMGFELGQYDPGFPSRALPEHRLLIINLNWKKQNEVPFSIAHEIGHIMNHDDGVRYYESETIKDKSEYQANVFAIKLLLKFCKLHDINFTNPVKFCEKFGIPSEFEYIVAMFINQNRVIEYVG